MSDTEKTPIIKGGTRPPPPRSAGPVSPPSDEGRWAAMQLRAKAITGKVPSIARTPLNEDGNQGEGNRTAARRYNDSVARHVASGAVQPAAENARASVERDDGRLEEAEARGRRPAELTMSARLRGTVNRVRRLILGLLRRPGAQDARPGQPGQPGQPG
jgi:hypothetical protein